MKKLTTVFIALVLMITSAQAYASNPVCETGCVEIISEVKEGSDKYMSWDMEIPQVEGLKSNKIEKKINKQLSGDIIRFKEELHKEAKKSYKESKGSKYPFRPYDVKTVYDVRYLDKDVLSLTVDKYQYTGGAHGMTFRTAYNYDLCTGKELGYQDIFKDYPDYKKVIVDRITEAILKNPEDYFSDAVDTVEKFTDDQPFYITDEGIVVYYGLYEIAPYAAGIREFLIPYSLFSK